MDVVKAQLKATEELCGRMEKTINRLQKNKTEAAVVRVYNPLTYARPAFEEYVTRYGASEKRVLFLGMNPGPWGMAQTGVPFGEVSAVRDWLHISAPIGRPVDEHPKYPVDGYACRRSEVSGRRLWGLFARRFVTPEAFFKEHFVVNYCPLLFIAASALANGKESARNLTPDKLSAPTRAELYEACDAHLRALAEALRPAYLAGIGNFAETRAAQALKGTNVKIVKILHPSPASPRSNTDWEGAASARMHELGIWRTFDDSGGSGRT